jgi:hypothetical protein
MLNWNRPLLLARASRPSQRPRRSRFRPGEDPAGALDRPAYGYRSMAAILSAYFIVSISVRLARMREISN